MNHETKIHCPVCSHVYEVLTVELKQLIQEDVWINHCESIFRTGGRASKLDILDKSLHTERMIKYYELYEKKIQTRQEKK